jgi:hypothetical protein
MNEEGLRCLASALPSNATDRIIHRDIQTTNDSISNEKKLKRIQPTRTGDIPSVLTPTVYSTAPFWTRTPTLKPNRPQPTQRTVELVCLFQAFKL